MDQQKIDRLFREKLDSFEVAPSAKSWSEVERKIGANGSPAKFYWIAAAVSAIIISWAAWPQEPAMNFTPIASEVNRPVPETVPEFTLPILIEETQEKMVQPKVRRQLDVQLVAQEPVKVQKDEMLAERVEKLPIVEAEPKIAVAVVEVEEIDLNTVDLTTMETEDKVEVAVEGKKQDNKIKVDLSKVKITYIAATTAETTQEKDSVGAFKKFIALAGKISPGDVLADMKTAKDDFINGGFKSKQKDRSSL